MQTRICPTCKCEFKARPSDPRVYHSRACAATARRKSDRQQLLDALYRFIVEFKRQKDGNTPTLEEIAMGCDLSSTSTAAYLVKELAADGRITLFGGGKIRRIAVVGGVWNVY